MSKKISLSKKIVLKSVKSGKNRLFFRFLFQKKLIAIRKNLKNLTYQLPIHKISPSQLSYLAGFIDADGSIIAQCKPTKTKRLGFKFSLTLQITQLTKRKYILEMFKRQIGIGTIRDRKKNGVDVSDFMIRITGALIQIFQALIPYLIIKKKQAIYALELFNFLLKKEKTRFFFKKLNYLAKAAKLVDKIANANDTKSNRINTGARVLEKINKLKNDPFFSLSTASLLKEQNVVRTKAKIGTVLMLEKDAHKKKMVWIRGEVYDSIQSAAKAENCFRHTIARRCNNPKNQDYFFVNL